MRPTLAGRASIVVSVAILLAAALPGCRDHVTDGCPGCPPPPPALGTPELVLEALQISYRRRDIDLYLDLLAPEFVFTFIPSDVQDLGLPQDFWTWGADSAGTARLFRSTLVSAVRIELTHGPATPTDDPGFPSGTMQLHVDQTSLEVDQTDGITWLINEPQDFFFRKGLAAADEDTTRWFILAWRDLDLSGRPSPLPGAATPAVESMSWGRLKALY